LHTVNEDVHEYCSFLDFLLSVVYDTDRLRTNALLRVREPVEVGTPVLRRSSKAKVRLGKVR
jgi:hypothetical protein